MIEKISLDSFNIRSFIEFLEKDRFTPLTAFLYLILIGFLRSVSESLYFEYPVFSKYIIAQHIAFNLPVLVLGVLVIQRATRVPLRKVFNVVLLGFWITVLPPFIDKYMFGLHGYEYSSMYAYYAGFEGALFIEKVALIIPSHIIAAEHISPGLRFMIVSIVLFSALYIIIKLELYKIKHLINNKKELIGKVASFIFGFVGIWFVVWFIISTVPTIISLEGNNIVILDYIRSSILESHYLFFSEYDKSPWAVNDTISFAEGTILQQRSLFITMYFTILTGISLLGSIYITNKKLLKEMIKRVRNPLVYSTTLLSLLGTGILHLTDGDFTKGWAIDPTYPLHIPYIFFAAAMGFFLGCFAIFCQRTFMSEKGKDDFSTKKDKNLAIVSLLAVVSFSLLMGAFNTFPLALFFLGVIFISSFYAEEFSIFTESISFTSIGIFSFLLGFYTPGRWKSVTWAIPENGLDPNTFETTNLTRSPPFTGTIVGFIIIIAVVMVCLFYFSKLLEKDKFPLDYPKSLVILPIFLLPNLIFQEIILVVLFGVIGAFCITFMDAKNDLPLYALLLQMIVLLIWVWEAIPFI